MSERTEFVGRTPTEWRNIREAINRLYDASPPDAGEFAPSVDDALDLIEEIDRRFDSER